MSTTEAQEAQCKTSDAVNDLVKQLLNQRAVFFVGAGFSLSDENVSVDKIMASLLCRFLAMTDTNILGDDSPFGGIRMACDQLFGLWLCGEEEDQEKIKDQLNQNAFWYSNAVIKKFVVKYYQINEWMVKSYGELYRYYSKDSPTLDDKISAINKAELEIRQAFFNEINTQSKDDLKQKDVLVEQSLLDKDFLALVSDDKAGKVIFIETVGLGNKQTMQSYTDSEAKPVSPRYHVFGKLAKEGLSPILITTNYDLLIERGYQAVGLEIIEAKSTGEFNGHLPQFVLSIRQPSDFFLQSSLNPTHILKIHGCAQQYREFKESLIEAEVDKLEAAKQQFDDYLKSIVYTYREIQHWRDDAWSRDYLQTLLRTKSFVFCGYSAADPVMHVTIRNIYEEMARKEVVQNSEDYVSPAFSTRGYTLEFDSLEILNAASKAIGLRDVPDGHNAFLQFDYYNKTFPGCDCLFRTILHRTLRQLQSQILNDHINPLTLTLFGKPRPADEVERIKESFGELIKNEKQQRLSIDPLVAEKAMEQQMAWTEHFHQQVLRLFQANEALRFSNPIEQGYIPLRKYPLWSCLSIILELALRQGYRQLFSFSDEAEFINAISGELPTVHICCNGQGPVALVIAATHTPQRTINKKRLCTQTKVWRLDIAGGFRQRNFDDEIDPNLVWRLAGH